MKVAIVNLTAGGISGGHKKYLVNVLPRLAAAPEVEKILFASPALMRAGDWLPCLPNVEIAICDPFSFIRPSPRPAFKAVLDVFNPDIVFVPIERHFNYTAAPIVTMVQNMAPLVDFSTTNGVWEKVRSLARRFETGLAVKKAETVITPTAFVGEAVMRHFSVEKKKVSVINFGHNPALTAKEPAKQVKDSLKDGFLFTAGSHEFYRGLEDLVAAMAVIKKSRPGMKLAVAGASRPETPAYSWKIKELAVSLGCAGDLLWLGQLPGDELAWFYANCSVFALTSRVESFCFVALEAMTYGCNMVSTDSPCLPEIVGGCAVYYKAGDIHALSKALFESLDRSIDMREKYSRSAMARAAAFSWDETVDKTLHVFERMLTKPVKLRGF